MAENAPKFVYKSRLTEEEHHLTEAAFKKFAETVDPNGQRFYKAGEFTPPEAQEGATTPGRRIPAGGTTPAATEADKK